MATLLYPSVEPSPKSDAEQIVDDAIGRLDSSWLYVRGVEIRLTRDSSPVAEVDFVLLHPDIGPIVVEVKGGEVRIDGEKWITRDRHGFDNVLDHDPVEKLRVRIEDIKTHLHSRLPIACESIPGVVLLPDTKGTLSGVSMSPGISVVSGSEWEQRLMAELEHLREVSEPRWRRTELMAIGRALSGSPKHAPVPLLAELESSSRQIETWTSSQIQLTLAQLEALAEMSSNLRFTVEGRAGTGKTVLALERARGLALEGYSPIVIVSRERLAADLRAANTSFEIGVDADIADGSLDLFKFDALLLDELQMLSSKTIDLVERRTQGSEVPVYYFVDPYQAFGPGVTAANDEALGNRAPSLARIGRNRWLQDREAPLAAAHRVGDWLDVGLSLDQVLRSTASIASLVGTIRGLPDAEGEVGGVLPQLVRHRAGSDVSVLSMLENTVVELLASHRISGSAVLVVVCENTIDVQDAVRAVSRATRLVARDQGTRPPPQAPEVLSVDDAHGVEGEVVIVVAPQRAELDDLRAQLYLATSRARSGLYVLAPQPLIADLDDEVRERWEERPLKGPTP